MPEACENWFCLVHSCSYYAHHTYDIYQALRYSVDFEIRW